MDKWTYMILNVIFFTPIFIFAWKRYHRIIIKEKAFIFSGAVFGLVVFFIVDPLATSWGAWGFDYSKTLNIRFGASVIEELIWAIALGTIMAIAVAAGVAKEERGSRKH